MELGTGIFLSAIFLGTVALFIATKDRWNWKRILLWSLGIIVIIAVIGGSIDYYLYHRYKDRDQPKKLTELWDISINDTAGDVKFKKGEPNKRFDDDLWVYGQEKIGGAYFVYFKNDRVRSVIYYFGLLNNNNAPSIPGVWRYDTSQKIDEKLGPPSYVSKSKDELRRAYSYERFNIVVHFERGSISAIGIYDPSSGAFRFKEESEGAAKPK